MTDAPLTDPQAFYDEYGHREWDRLERSFHGRLEWEGTIEQLEGTLPESGHVLDVGGGAGRYTVWLAEQGYDVTLVDLSSEQLSIAREKVTERDLDDRVTIQQGDVRDLSFAEATFDTTLCLGGPLSHVTEAAERERAVEELRRVTVPGAPVVASVLGRLSLLQIMATGQVGLDSLTELATTGDYSPEYLQNPSVGRGFTSIHTFRADEFEDLLASGGLDVHQVIGLEGLASGYAESSIRESADDLDDEDREHVRDLVDLFREDRTVADLSAHMLAVCEA